MERPSTLPVRPQTQKCPATWALERQDAADRRSLESFELFRRWSRDGNDEHCPRRRCGTDYPSSSHPSTRFLVRDLDGAFPPIEWDPSGDLQEPCNAAEDRRPAEDGRRRWLLFKRPRAQPQLQRSPECIDTTSLLDIASSCLQ